MSRVLLKPRLNIGPLPPVDCTTAVMPPDGTGPILNREIRIKRRPLKKAYRPTQELPASKKDAMLGRKGVNFARVLTLFLLGALLLALLPGCAGVRASAGAEAGAPADEGSRRDRKVRTRDVDFARAFEEEPSPRDVSAPPAGPQARFVHSLRYPSIAVNKRPVRVLVRQDLKSVSILSGAIVRASASGVSVNFRGRIHIESDIIGTGAVIATVNSERREMRLPCTLYTASGEHQFSIGDSKYRGALIIVPEGGGNNFSIVNELDVEDYLRGVVPLEIGNLREPDIEAVKAQAVAARTYTYRRMAANAARAFDVHSTVTDQVYGGAGAETQTADMAVRFTKDLILAYEDEIVHAYYHSTCGGRTANIEDVWGGPAVPYLRSLSDADDQGRAFCAGSGTYTWAESWPADRLAATIKRHSSEGNLQPAFKGNLRKIEVRERFECGRVKRLVITSNSGEHVAGGDKLRFMMRRNTTGNPILRSSNIKTVNISGGTVTVTGGGHGHGIGMCQVGAIGRARGGQNYEQILRAYYRGALLRTVIPNNR